MTRRAIRCLLTALLAVVAAMPGAAWACPFCAAGGQTLSEELGTADIVLLAQLVYLPDESKTDADDAASLPAIDLKSGNAKFKVVRVVKGQEHAASLTQVEATFFGQPKPDTVFMITGLGAESPQWTTPLPVGTAAQRYIAELPDLSVQGADRLVFFQDYLEHKDPMLAQDAYDEFARAPYRDVVGLRDRMRHDQLIAWIKDLSVPPSHRRLYLTMLSVCGGPGDVEMLESMIRSDDKKVKSALDALIGCYLTLKGVDGLSVVDELFLNNPDATYKETYDAVMALRFHGQETDIIPRERLLVSMRYLLDNPDLADQAITDLTRWKDWSVLERLVELFKQKDDQSKWSRVPIAQYLMVCSREETEVGRRAKTALDELTQLHPDVIKRAKAYFAFGGFAAARVKPAAVKEAPTETEKTDSTEKTDPSVETQPAAGAPATEESPGADVPEAPNVESPSIEAPSRLKLVVVSLASALVLLALLWLILRGAGQQPQR